MTILISAVLIVLVASAICAGVEAALFSIPLIKARQLAEAKVKGANSLRKICENMNRPIAMIVILTNLSNIVGSMVIGVLAANTLESHWIGIFSTIFTLIIIMFSEIIPKTLGEKHNEKISLLVAPPVLFLTKILLPIIWLIEKVTNPFTKGGDDEFEMIQGVFKLNDLSARDLMTPRLAMTCISADKTVLETQDELLESQHSRIVATSESRDDVKGFVLKSELLAAIVRGNGKSKVSEFLLDPLVVSETQKADEVLPLFQRSRKHLAIVKDEFGGVSGLITLEDIIEELTGEIVDETDAVEDMRELSNKE